MALAKGKLSSQLFVDLAKAFDTVDHRIGKLDYAVVRGSALNLFESYISNRKQFVSISNIFSWKLLERTGVPRGSVLGPLLFLIYAYK